MFPVQVTFAMIMYREWRNSWPSDYRCYRSRLLRKGNKLNIVPRNCKIIIEMKLEMSDYHENNWFLGSRKVYEPLATISGGKIYQAFLHVGPWTCLEIRTMVNDYEISSSIPIFKKEEKMKREHYISITSHDRRLQYCQQMTPNFFNSPALVGKKDISRKFKSQKWLQLWLKLNGCHRQFGS